jgi:hypothetical protein
MAEPMQGAAPASPRSRLVLSAPRPSVDVELGATLGATLAGADSAGEAAKQASAAADVTPSAPRLAVQIPSEISEIPRPDARMFAAPSVDFPPPRSPCLVPTTAASVADKAKRRSPMLAARRSPMPGSAGVPSAPSAAALARALAAGLPSPLLAASGAPPAPESLSLDEPAAPLTVVVDGTPAESNLARASPSPPLVSPQPQDAPTLSPQLRSSPKRARNPPSRLIPEGNGKRSSESSPMLGVSPRPGQTVPPLELDGLSLPPGPFSEGNAPPSSCAAPAQSQSGAAAAPAAASAPAGRERNIRSSSSPRSAIPKGEDEVEWITSSRARDDGVTEYRVRWKGYAASHDTWEPIEHLGNAKAKLDAFHLREKRKGNGALRSPSKRSVGAPAKLVPESGEVFRSKSYNPNAPSPKVRACNTSPLPRSAHAAQTACVPYGVSYMMH